MRFSIIIPVYNVEQFLAKCLDSALQQSFDDYEIIAVNDGSTDHSRKILAEYECLHDKLSVIDQQNKGLGGARNTGIQHAAGEFVVFLDSDDYIIADTLRILDDYLQAFELDVLAFDCNMVNVSGDILQIATVADYSDEFTCLSGKQFLRLEPTACLKVYRRTLFCEHKIWFPERLWYEDLATVFKMVPYVNHAGYLKKPLYNYVQHGASITHSKNMKRMMEIVPAFESMWEYYEQQGFLKEFYDELEWNCILHVLYYSAFRFLESGYHRKAMKKMMEYCDMRFPGWEKNPYLEKEKKRRYLMELVVQRQFLKFYLQTGFFLRYISPQVSRIQRIRGVICGDKAKNS